MPNNYNNTKPEGRNLRILQVLLSSRIGGAETLAYSLAKEWRQSGIDTDITYLDVQGSNSRSRVRRILDVRRAYKKYQPDVILSHSALPNAYCRLALPRKAAIIPVLHSSADDYSARTLRYLEMAFLKLRNDSIVAVSKTAKEKYTARFPNVSCIKIIENGISDPGFHPRSAPTVPRIVTTARVSAVKNPWLWSSVVAEFESTNTPVSFEWIGPIDSQVKIDSLVKSHNSKSSVGQFLGARAEAAQYLSDYDIYFHPSDREALSMSILEAIMSGLPVVASESVANSMGSNLIAEPFVVGDPTSAVNAIERIRSDYSSYAAAGKERRKFVLNRYGISNTAMSYLNLFDSIS